MKKRPYTTGEKVIMCLLKCGVLFGILMIVGGVGNIDFADEAGIILTKNEEIKSYFISIMGIPITVICMYVLSKIADM